jgi:tetratricopeptide (TPR) repeat protein
MSGTFDVGQGGTNWRLLFFELFVAFTLSVTYYFLVVNFAVGGLNNISNSWVFTSCSIPTFHFQQLGDVWKGRLSGLLLSGWLFDFVVKNHSFKVEQYECLFALYQSFWLFLLLLTVIFALRHSLFINLGIFAGLMYNFTPASGQYSYPWDLPATLFFTLAVLFFERRRMLLMAAATCAGCFFKETVLVCALLALFASHWKWGKRVLTLAGIVAVYVLGKKFLLSQLHFQVAAFSMENATNLATLFQSTSVVDNLKRLLSPTFNHAIFANAGTLAAVLVLGWRRRFLPYMTVILAFVVGHFIFAGIGEFHQLWQVLPLSLMLLSERWEEFAGSGATGKSSGGPVPAWAVRETFPVLVPLAVVVMGLSTGIAAWHCYRIVEIVQPALRMRYKIVKHVLKREMDVSDLKAASQLYQIGYAESELTLSMLVTNCQRSCDWMEARCQSFRAKYVETELQLAQISTDNQQFSDAITHLQQVLELDTNSDTALNNLACLRATASDPGFRNGNEAVRLAERACSLTQYKDPFLITTLAAAYAEAGRFDDAVVTARKAHAMALAQGLKELAAQEEQLLELYKSGRPYHQEAKAAP